MNANKTTLNFREIHTVSGRIVSDGYNQVVASLDEARALAQDRRDSGHDDGYEFQLVRVCDDIDSDDYCQIVEVIESL